VLIRKGIFIKIIF
jgi:hypothetical protein